MNEDAASSLRSTARILDYETAAAQPNEFPPLKPNDPDYLTVKRDLRVEQALWLLWIRALLKT